MTKEEARVEAAFRRPGEHVMLDTETGRYWIMTTAERAAAIGDSRWLDAFFGA